MHIFERVLAIYYIDSGKDYELEKMSNLLTAHTVTADVFDIIASYVVSLTTYSSYPIEG